jgi:hypothetical protein
VAVFVVTGIGGLRLTLAEIEQRFLHCAEKIGLLRWE